MDRSDPRCPECDRPTWREGKLCHRCIHDEMDRVECWEANQREEESDE